MDWVGLTVSGDDANCTVLGSKGEVILTLERLSSGGLSLSIIHSNDGSVMVESEIRSKSVAVSKLTVDGQTVVRRF